MEDRQNELITALCEKINHIKRTGFTADIVGLESYLGGDLGIDSMEMLEIWVDLEKHFNIFIDDANKRDVYTVGEVIDVLNRHLK